MSKTMKEIIIREYEGRFDGASEAALISMRGIGAIDTNRIRAELRKKNIRVSVVRNNLAKKAIAGTSLEPLTPLLQGSNALAVGGQSVVEVARELVRILEQVPSLELRGAVLDGQLFEGDAGVKALSKYPTREEAIAKVVTLLLGPGRNLSAQLKGPGSKVAGIVKTIQDKLEKGEAIAKVG